MHLTLFRRRTEIRIRHTRRILLAPLLTKREHNDRQQLLLLEQPDEVDPEVRVFALVVPIEPSSATSTLSGHRSSGGDLTSGVSSASVRAARGRSTASGGSTTTSGGTTPTGRRKTGSFSVLVLLTADRLGRFLVTIARSRSAKGEERGEVTER
jgi:hypothetical protein